MLKTCTTVSYEFSRALNVITRRASRCLLLAVLLSALVSVALPTVALAGVADGILNIHATFSGDPRHEVTVSWRTRTPLPSPVVRLGLADAPEDAWSEVKEFETVESAGGFNHHVKLVGLKPDTRYAYRVSGPGKAWGPVCKFRTGPEDRSKPFTFAVIGDVQGRAQPSVAWQTLGRWVAEQDVAFMLQLGDLVQTGGDQAELDAFFNSATPESDRSLFHSMIFMPLLGNHDHQITSEQEAAEDTHAGVRLYLDQFRLPANENPLINGRNYTFTYGDSRFVIMDTSGRGPEGSTHPEQTKWLASLDLEDRPWVLAAHHVPIFRFRNHVPSTSGRNVWRPHFYTRYMDIVFNGHNHSHAISWPLAEAQLDGYNGGLGFAGPWEARTDVGDPAGMDSLFILEENDLVRYKGYQAVGRSLPTLPLGTHGDKTSDARRALKPIDTSEKRVVWMGYAWQKFEKYYGGGGWVLSDSTKPSQRIRVGTTRVMTDEGRFGHFEMALGEKSAVSQKPIIDEGKVPEEPFFVLVKLVFENNRVVGHLKSYQSPEAMPAKEPDAWDIVLEAEGDWALKLDALTHLGKGSNRLALVDEFRLGERMADVLLVPETGAVERSPLVEERFEVAPTLDRNRGVVYYDGGGVNSNGEARDEWFVRFRQDQAMPIVGLVTIDSTSMKVRVVFYDDFGDDKKAGDLLHEFELRQ